MKLFFSPGACSCAPHIVMSELGMKFELEKVDLKTKKSKSGDFNKINPKGYVPVLQLDSGEILTEGAVIMQYLADQKPEAKLLPKAGTMERYHAMEWLNFIATEVHKNLAGLFHVEEAAKDKAGQEHYRAFKMEAVSKRFNYLSEQLKGKTFLMGNQFTVADAYLFTVLSWSKWLHIDMAKWPALMGYCERIQMRPAVVKALELEKNAK